MTLAARCDACRGVLPGASWCEEPPEHIHRLIVALEVAVLAAERRKDNDSVFALGEARTALDTAIYDAIRSATPTLRAPEVTDEAGSLLIEAEAYLYHSATLDERRAIAAKIRAFVCARHDDDPWRDSRREGTTVPTGRRDDSPEESR